MNAALIEVFRYSLPLVRPIMLKGTPVSHRRGVLIHLSDRAGREAWGDAAPLPGFSVEDAQAAEAAAVQWAHRATGTGGVEAAHRDDLPPAVRFAAETAAWEFALGPVAPPPGRRRRLPINALLAGSPDDIRRRAQEVCELGYSCVKMKVGQPDLDSDIVAVRAVRRIMGPAAAIRLDANRAWTYAQAIEFAKAVRDVGIEYIEEPLAAPDRLWELAVEADLPVALDESVIERAGEGAFPANCPWAAAIILKPTLLGGANETLRIASAALNHGIRPVISGCFESGVGVAALARIAIHSTWFDTPAGLDTYYWLAEDVLARRFAICEGTLDMAEIEERVKEVQVDRLQRVFHL